MATYAIGDVQGCHDELMCLLQRIDFDPVRDRLWFVGDLVNRGPKSLEVLRFVRSLGDRAVTVLGNHDLSLLVIAAGVRKPHRGDTWDAILTAPDRDDLLHWVRHQRLFHVENGQAMVHAGLLPQWTVEQARSLAAEVEAELQGPGYPAFLNAMYGNEPAQWDDGLRDHDRLRVIVNAMTRLRLCTVDGRMEFSHKTGPAGGPADYHPWFEIPSRRSADTPIVFGHWAALGLTQRDTVTCIDTGCVWGRRLTALRLEDRQLFDCDCSAVQAADGSE